MTETWLSDPRTVLGVISMAAAFILNAGIMIWVSSKWFAKLDGRVLYLERSIIGRPALDERFIKVESELHQLRSDLGPRLNRIEDKLDRLSAGKD